MSDDSIQNQINAMVASQVAKATNPTLANSGRSGDTEGSWRATNDGTTTTVEILSAPTAPTDRIPDNGVVTAAEAAKLKADIDALQGKLNDFTYDQHTGEPVYILEPGTRERANVEKQLEWSKKRAAIQLEIYRRLDEQRANDAKAAESTRVREAYVQGNPNRARLLDEALERKRAEAVADRIFADEIAKASKK